MSNRRSEILKATIRVLDDEGLFRVTTRQIAREAQVNVATVHYYFKSKESLIEAVSSDLHDQLLNAIERFFADDARVLQALQDPYYLTERNQSELQEHRLLRFELFSYHIRTKTTPLLESRLGEYSQIINTAVARCGGDGRAGAPDWKNSKRSIMSWLAFSAEGFLESANWIGT